MAPHRLGRGWETLLGRLARHGGLWSLQTTLIVNGRNLGVRQFVDESALLQGDEAIPFTLDASQAGKRLLETVDELRGTDLLVEIEGSGQHPALG